MGIRAELHGGRHPEKTYTGIFYQNQWSLPPLVSLYIRRRSANFSSVLTVSKLVLVTWGTYADILTRRNKDSAQWNLLTITSWWRGYFLTHLRRIMDKHVRDTLLDLGCRRTKAQCEKVRWPWAAEDTKSLGSTTTPSRLGSKGELRKKPLSASNDQEMLIFALANGLACSLATYEAHEMWHPLLAQVAREAVAPCASPGYLDARYDNAT